MCEEGSGTWVGWVNYNNNGGGQKKKRTALHGGAELLSFVSIT